MARDTVRGTFLVATILCVVCSVLVTGTAVGLRSKIEANKKFDQRKNVLIAAGLFDPATDDASMVDEAFKSDEESVDKALSIDTVLIDLETGMPVEEGTINLDEYNQRDAAGKAELSTEVSPAGALPGISRRERYAFVYVVNKNGSPDQTVFPMYGKGLWSTLYGFLSLDKDCDTVRGITFYEHKETPGLGAKIDLPEWKALWEGKTLHDAKQNVVLKVIKGAVQDNSATAEHEVDGLTGATITSRGVSDLVNYWFGPDGFGPYLAKQKTTMSDEVPPEEETSEKMIEKKTEESEATDG